MGAIKTILLMIASAIVGIVLFVIGVLGWVTYRVNQGGSLPSITFPGGTGPQRAESVVHAPPEFKEHFLGTSGSFSGDFANDRSKVLAAGPGLIAGTVRVDGKPAAGLRLRLALNGSVLSQWAEVDSGGRYAVSVPYGKYRVDGYELHYSTTGAVLGGKTDSPKNHRHPRGEPFTVGEGRPGPGPELEYVDPVVKIGPKGPVSAASPVVVSWQPYPKAEAYRVQLTEQPDEGDYANQRHLFDWREPPTVTGTSLDLAQQGVQLKKGYVYTVEITALDADRRPIADSPRSGAGPDFRVTE
jgi:hypothetical protein